MHSYTTISTFVALGAVAARAVPASYPAPIFIPTSMEYGSTGKLYADVKWGPNPNQQIVKTVMDLGSAANWVYGNQAQIVYGPSQGGFGVTCYQNISAYFDVKETAVLATKKPFDGFYSYGGNSKQVSAYYTVNSTMSFPSSGSISALENVEVAISNSTSLQTNSCGYLDPVSSYDEAILGLAYGVPYSDGPYFREDLYHQGTIQSQIMSMWMDNETSGSRTLHGTVLFGAVAPSKFAGDLVFVDLLANDKNPGYAVNAPVISVSSMKNPSKYTHLTSANATKAAVAGGTCLFDSGSSFDTLPVDGEKFAAAAGLEFDSTVGAVFHKGPCHSISNTATIKYEFAASNGGQPVTVNIPLRLYARDILQYKEGSCTLTLSFDDVASDNACLLSAAFLSGAYIAIDDAHRQLAIAQGGVSTGATKGSVGIGMISSTKKGSKIPAR